MTIEHKFWKFHEKNPEIYKLFVSFALKAKQTGMSHYSAWAIGNRVRWELDIVTTDRHSKFKISNDYFAYYARLIMKEVPELQDFFETHKMKREPSFVEAFA